MGKQQQNKKRTNIIQVILDDYESGNKDWRTYPDENVTGNRTIHISQELYDEIGKNNLNRQVLELQEEQLLQDGNGRGISGWYVRGSELEKIEYNLQNIRTFYERDGRIPKYILHYKPIH